MYPAEVAYAAHVRYTQVHWVKTSASPGLSGLQTACCRQPCTVQHPQLPGTSMCALQRWHKLQMSGAALSNLPIGPGSTVTPQIRHVCTASDTLRGVCIAVEGMSDFWRLQLCTSTGDSCAGKGCRNKTDRTKDSPDIWHLPRKGKKCSPDVWRLQDKARESSPDVCTFRSGNCRVPCCLVPSPLGTGTIRFPSGFKVDAGGPARPV